MKEMPLTGGLKVGLNCGRMTFDYITLHCTTSLHFSSDYVENCKCISIVG